LSKKNIKILILFLLISHNITAQKNKIHLQIITNNQEIDFNKKYLNKTFNDTLETYKEINSIRNELINDAYILASLDSIITDSTIIRAYFHVGEQYKWGNFSLLNFENFILRKLNINYKKINKKTININKLNITIEKLLQYYENNGYPFSEIYLENVKIKNDSVFADLQILKNNLIKIDSIIIKGNAKISDNYIQKHIGIKQGDFYNEKKIIAVENKLKELIFIKQIRSSEVGFGTENSKIYLYIDDKKANQFNGILGIVPNDKTTGKLLLTGELRLFLINSFKKGEIISFNWKKLESLSQNLDAKFMYPFLFEKPIGIDATFTLLKKDTSYLNVNSNLGLLFLIDGTNYIKGYIENKNSSLISTTGLEYTTTLPQYADINTVLYGIGIYTEYLDYKFNPRKGFSLIMNIGAGNKEIKKNNNINPEIYEDIDLNTQQLEGQIDASVFLPLSQNTVIKFRNHSGYMYSNTLFENELFKIGGLKTLRGFDEESVFASAFSISTIEYRLIIEQNSTIYAFIDGGFYEKKINEYVSDTPFGFGFGLDFETKAGIFTINYALGKQFDNPIEFRSAKIHFGFVNRF